MLAQGMAGSDGWDQVADPFPGGAAKGQMGRVVQPRCQVKQDQYEERRRMASCNNCEATRLGRHKPPASCLEAGAPSQSTEPLTVTAPPPCGGTDRSPAGFLASTLFLFTASRREVEQTLFSTFHRCREVE